MSYGVHMRNTPDSERGTWATYARVARENALLSKTALAVQLGVDRGTVHRWENGTTRPESPHVVARFAEVTNVDQDEALAAAGLRPGVDAPSEPTADLDEEIQLVVTDPKLSPATKKRIIDHILERRERERTQGVEQTRLMIETLRNQGTG